MISNGVIFRFFLLFLLCLLLTQSRTVFIALVLTMVLFTIYMILTNNFSAKNKYITMVIVFLIFLAICLPILIIYAKNNLEYLYNGLNLVYERLLNFHFNDFIYSSPSITSRYEQLMFVMNSIDQIPLIGVGIGKAVLMPESFYALYLYRVGVIGILMHVVMLILAFKKCSELAVKYKYDVSLNCFFMSFQFYLISLPFSYASSALNDQVRSGFIFYVLLGMVFKCSDNFKKV
ncbi:O-antigen ligase family protein [Pectobacterium parvum]